MATPATILLVEDEESLQEGISDLLEIADIGYDLSVIIASDGNEGLEAMRTLTPDLIISDIMMPNMDGYQFLTAVRAVPQWVHIPFIFLTAKGKKQDVFKGKLSGAELYITKPFDSTELLELVETQLQRSFQRQTAQQENLQNFKRSILQLLNHEFRTPLTYVTAYYEMLIDSFAIYEDTENLEAYLNGIYAGCTRLTNLIEDLILVMDIRTGETAKTFQEQGQIIHSIGEILREAGEEIEEEAKSKGIRLQYDIARNLPDVYGVPSYLATVFEHLLRNAIKFFAYKMGGEKVITLYARANDERVILRVIDNSIGIPTGSQNQIFDLFYQYNRDFFEQQGSGSGLAISKGLIELHNGQITVKSELDQGSTFTIKLPVHEQNQPIPIPNTSEQKTNAHIIVVEDDYYLLDGLRELLELYDGPYELTVDIAQDGVEGLKAIERKQPDLIISDIMMPNMDGFEFLEQVRSHSEWLHIPIIFLTAKGDPTDIHRGRQSGVEEYITKPYDSDELLDLVTIQLNRYYQLLQVANEGFDNLKQSVLNLLQPNLRTPLNSVANYSENISELLQEAETPSSFKQALRGIQQGSSQISELVEDFILLAEIKTGEAQHAFNMRAAPVPNSGVLLQMAAQEFERDSLQNGVVIDTSGAGQRLPPVEIDYDGFFNGLQRLIAAVLQACHDGHGQTVHFEARETNDSVELLAWHDGEPLTPTLRQKIETLFEFGSEEGIIDETGYGPQLCIVHGLTRINQGHVYLEQDAKGHDVFVISLPLYQERDTIDNA